MEGGENPENQQNPSDLAENYVKQNTVPIQNQTIIAENPIISQPIVEKTPANLETSTAKPTEAPESTAPATTLVTQENLVQKLEEESPVEQTQPSPQIIKKERKIIKLFRIFVWLLVAIALPVGFSIQNRAESIESFADGTASLKSSIGGTIFYAAFITGGLNLIWGAIRWILRIKRNHCSVGRIIGKLIGGGIWRTAVFVPIVIFSFFFLSAQVNEMIEEKYLSDQELQVTSSEKITEDYNNGLISTDEYVRNLLYASFDTSSLPEKYQSQSEEMVPDFGALVEAYYGELSEETLEIYYRIYTLSNIRFSTEIAEQSSAARSLFSQNAYAAEETSGAQKLSVLNRALLSPERHFVVFYTDQGEEKITDDEAEKIGEYFEDYIKKYSSRFGFNYSYEPTYYHWLTEESASAVSSSLEDIKKVLAANDIDDMALEYAMPIYVAMPADCNAKAFYAGINNADVLSNTPESYANDTSQYVASVPSVPFITIRPSKINDPSTPLITAHEFGHHYQALFLNGESRVSTDFTGEGTAHLMAINIANDDSSLENDLNDEYNNMYLGEGVSMAIDEVLPGHQGYPAFAWFENLFELTGENMNSILEMLKYENELEYAKETFGDDILKQTLVQLAERNLTGDYDDLPFYNQRTPIGEGSVIDDYYQSSTSDIQPTALQYKYLDANRQEGAVIIAAANQDFITLSLLGETAGGWEIIESDADRVMFTTSIASAYDRIAIVGINYDTETIGSFSIVTSNDVELYQILTGDDFTDIFNAEGINDETENSNITSNETIFGGLAEGCSNIDDVLEIPELIMELGNTMFDDISGTSKESDYSAFKDEWSQKSEEIKSDVEKTKQQLSGYEINICVDYAQPGTDFDDLKEKILGLSDWSMQVIDMRDDDFRISVLAEYRLSIASGKVYSIFGEDNNVGIISFDIR